MLQCCFGVLDHTIAGAPGVRQFVSHPQGWMALVEQLLPGQSYGQQMHDLRVIGLGQTRLPALVGAPRGPAVNAHEQCREIGLVCLWRHTQGVQGSLNQRYWLRRQRCQALREAAQAHQHRRAEVMG